MRDMRTYDLEQRHRPGSRVRVYRRLGMQRRPSTSVSRVRVQCYVRGPGAKSHPAPYDVLPERQDVRDYPIYAIIPRMRDLSVGSAGYLQ